MDFVLTLEGRARSFFRHVSRIAESVCEYFDFR